MRAGMWVRAEETPYMVKAFLGATVRSVTETVRDPAGPVAAVAAAADEIDAKRESKVLEHTIPYWKSAETETSGFGSQSEQRWRDSIEVARKLGLIESALRPQDVFTDSYLAR